MTATVSREGVKWRHIVTGTIATFDGEERGPGGPFARMRTEDGVVARIDPLDLVCIPRKWEIVKEQREDPAS